MKRRSFLTAAVAAIPAATFGQPLALAAEPSSTKTTSPAEGKEGEMKYRMLGRTGQKVSILGLGGYHLGMLEEEKDSIDLIRAAIDGGITFMDNCWDYHNGASEIRMGKALKDGYREKVFLMSKIDGRTKALAAQQLEQSLQRLQTDHIDLMQHHEVIRIEDPDRIFAEGGAMEALVEAQAAGKIRFIGFTGHKDPMVHLRTLDIAREKGFRFDAVQMPLNVLDAHFRSFQEQVLPVLLKEENGVLGMKSMASGHALSTKTVTPQECLQFAMSLPTSVVIAGMENKGILRKNLDVAYNFTPLSDVQIAALLERTAEPGATGKYELFKTATQFDATARNPDWLG
ncbi:MAG: aldo/keto reductase [Candidatus Hydrogenedentes bacterium]|nr:aldo/keto reductase [Candidatus Hydrogenedentota bacterium]